uniref:MULE transposase domain-containing protein n=1 Tax=Strigamia maritima TaxID=126957 RepID=T1J943_STRMM
MQPSMQRSRNEAQPNLPSTLHELEQYCELCICTIVARDETNIFLLLAKTCWKPPEIPRDCKWMEQHKYYTDFESGLLPAIERGIPNARNQGCWFHYCQALWRNVQLIGLTNGYKTNITIKLIVRKSMALPLLPAADIRAGMTSIRNSTWIDRIGVERLTVNGEPGRTNNAVESFHSTLRRRTNNANHPNIWKFLDTLIRVENSNFRDYRLSQTGAEPRKKRKTKYAILNKKAQTFMRDYANNFLTIEQFLKKISFLGLQFENRIGGRRVNARVDVSSSSESASNSESDGESIDDSESASDNRENASDNRENASDSSFEVPPFRANEDSDSDGVQNELQQLPQNPLPQNPHQNMLCVVC